MSFSPARHALWSRRRGLAVGAILVLGGIAIVAAETGSAATSASPPTNTTRPAVSGKTRDGSTLTTSNGRWTGAPTSFEYDWERCDADGANCGDISGANSKQYTLTSTDVGRRLRSRVTAVNGAGSTSATSNATARIAAAGTGPTSQSRPTISGNAQEGATLTVTHGKWNGAAPITITEQWMRCDSGGNNCADIAGATGTIYTLVATDVGHTMRVRETAKNARGTSSASSDPTALVAPAKSGGAAIAVSQVSPPDRLVVDRVKFSPQPLRSRGTLTARFHVSDLRGFSIQGALVYALGLPYGWVGNAPEVQTDSGGWATIALHPTRALPLRRGGALVVFVRARKPGDNLLAGVSTRRLVQASVGAPR